MFDGTTDEISKLIEPGRVHRRVYVESLTKKARWGTIEILIFCVTGWVTNV